MAVRRSIKDRLRDSEDDLRQMIAKVGRSAAKDFFGDQREAEREARDADFERHLVDMRERVMAGLFESYGITPSSVAAVAQEWAEKDAADASDVFMDRHQRVEVVGEVRTYRPSADAPPAGADRWEDPLPPAGEPWRATPATTTEEFLRMQAAYGDPMPHAPRLHVMSEEETRARQHGYTGPWHEAFDGPVVFRSSDVVEAGDESGES